jgi:spore germination cell wall hydrolase CwlJ-like protein
MRLVCAYALAFLCLYSTGSQATEPVPQRLANEMYCLARVVYGEARGLRPSAQIDVALSVMNRVALNRRDFGGATVCGVVFYPRQYSSIKGSLEDGWQPGDLKAWFTSLTVAWRVYTRRVVAEGAMRKALYFMNPIIADPGPKGWFANLRPIRWSQAHRFYGEY